MTDDEVREFHAYVVAVLCGVDDILESGEFDDAQKVAQARAEIARVLRELTQQKGSGN